MADEPHLMPWHIEAMDAASTYGLPGNEAIDLVILDWLSRGDPKAYYDFVLSGHQPSRRVLQAVAFMMMRGDPDCDFDPGESGDPDLANAVPFALEVKTGKRGPRERACKRTRDRIIAREVALQMTLTGSYDASVAAVHEWLAGIGFGVSVQTVRDAYDTRAASYGR